MLAALENASASRVESAVRLMRVAFVLLIGVVTGDAVADERVDLELVLLAHASRSIDDREIRLQRQGYAAAITHPDVLAAISHGYGQRTAITYVEMGRCRLAGPGSPRNNQTANRRRGRPGTRIRRALVLLRRR